MINFEPMLTSGNMLTLKKTFLTKNELLVTALTPEVNAFEIKNHGIMPQVSHKKNGVSPRTGAARNPKVNTNQITPIKVNGCTNAHRRPK